MVTNNLIQNRSQGTTEASRIKRTLRGALTRGCKQLFYSYRHFG